MQTRTLGRAGVEVLTKEQKKHLDWNHPLFDGPACPTCGQQRWVVLWWGGVGCRRCGGPFPKEEASREEVRTPVV